MREIKGDEEKNILKDNRMNILKEVLKYEVFPALGCTEPIAVACAAGTASAEICGDIEKIEIKVDPGIYKNGFAVTIPNTKGEKGNLIAGVIGALIKHPELKMEILKNATDDIIKKAKELIETKKASILCDREKLNLYIEVCIKTKNQSVKAIIKNAHTNLVYLEKNNKVIFKKEEKDTSSEAPGIYEYKKILKKMKIADFIDLAENIDKEDFEYIKSGIDLNLKISEAGLKLKKVGYYISKFMNKGNDIASVCKILTASAADARMAGVNLPVMASGGSGNQGIVAILVPYKAAEYFNIKEEKMIKSIALSHLINSFIKCFIGSLSAFCGCAITAGAGAASAIVYQNHGKDMKKIGFAINNLFGDLGGMFCDGAKGGCALKIASSTDSTIKSAFMALNDYGITDAEGFIGKTPEETILNLSKISREGMKEVDNIILDIMKNKSEA